MGKKTRCFSYGGSAADIAGDLASPGLYDNDRGMSIGLSGAKHFTATDANNATPADQMQQYVGMKGTNSPSSQSRRDASPLTRLDQEIAMGNAMGGLSNTERYQLANPDNQPYTVGAPQGGRRGNPSVSVGVSPGSSAAASQEAQRIGIMQSLRNNLAEQPLYAGFSNGGIVGKLKEAITGEKEPPPKSTTIGIRGRSDDMQVPAFANGGSVRQEPTQSPNANWGKRPQMDETTQRIVNAAGRVVDHPVYAAAQFNPATSIPLGGIAAGVHALQGRTDELPLDAAAMIPAAKGVMLAKGAKLAAQKAIGTTGRVANGVQALSSVDAFGSPAFANGGKIKGPGTPTSDSIAAKVKQTGEPIAVSTGERIVSKAQDTFLQKIAQGMGYGSVDAMLEAGTGKPVGPTIKVGVKHASSGSPSIAELEAKRAPWLKGFADTIGGGIDTVQNVAKAITGHGEEAQGVINESSKDVDSVNSVGAKLNRAGKGVLAAIPAVAVDTYKALSPVVSPLLTGEDVAQPNPASAPSPVKPSQAAPERKSEGYQDSSGWVRSSEGGFTPDNQQIAQFGGVSQGRSSVDATQMKAPDGGGYITNGAGKAMKIEANGGAWEDTKQYKDAITQNVKDKELLAQMQRDRLMRDMGADITSQGTRVSAAQQLAQMDKNRALDVAEGRSAAEERLKGQQIAQLEQENALRTGVLKNDPDSIASWNRLHPSKGEYIKVSDGEEVDANGNVLRRPDRIVNVATGQALGGVQQKSIATDPKAIAIRDNKNLSIDEKKKQLAALGYGG